MIVAECQGLHFVFPQSRLQSFQQLPTGEMVRRAIHKKTALLSRERLQLFRVQTHGPHGSIELQIREPRRDQHQQTLMIALWCEQADALLRARIAIGGVR